MLSSTWLQKHGPLPHCVLPRHVCRQVDWVLIDGMQGGSGSTLDWSRLAPPSGFGSRGWILAGGLTPQNVSKVSKNRAHVLLRPQLIVLGSVDRISCHVMCSRCFSVHLQAHKLCAPAVLDVSSGVCGPDGLMKDALKILDFITAAKDF